MIRPEEAREVAQWLRAIGVRPFGREIADLLAATYTKMTTREQELSPSLLEVARKLRRACLDVAVVAMAQRRLDNPQPGGDDGPQDGGDGEGGDAGGRAIPLEPVE